MESIVAHDRQPEALAIPEAARLARVEEASDGVALRVTDLATATNLPVAGHLHGVARLSVGDTVCLINSPQGGVILDRLRRPGDGPAADIQEADGHLAISAGQSVTLNAGASRIELRTDGTIRVNGTTVHQIAQQRLTLVSASLELN